MFVLSSVLNGLVYKLALFIVRFCDFKDETAQNSKGRRGSAGRPRVSRIMKDVQEGEALLKVCIVIVKGCAISVSSVRFN